MAICSLNEPAWRDKPLAAARKNSFRRRNLRGAAVFGGDALGTSVIIWSVRLAWKKLAVQA
jgi:hypothetical protein